MKKYSEALRDLNAAIEADPALSEAYRHRASILRQLCRSFWQLLAKFNNIICVCENEQNLVLLVLLMELLSLIHFLLFLSS